EQVGVEGQSVQAPRPPRSADLAGPLAGCQPGMRGWVGEVLLGPRVVQPQGVLGRRQLVSLEESLEDQIAPVTQIRHKTVENSHRRRQLDASPASLKSDWSIVHMWRVSGSSTCEDWRAPVLTQSPHSHPMCQYSSTGDAWTPAPTPGCVQARHLPPARRVLK